MSTEHSLKERREENQKTLNTNRAKLESMIALQSAIKAQLHNQMDISRARYHWEKALNELPPYMIAEALTNTISEAMNEMKVSHS
ncbi:hypothetical protein ACR8TE_003592 [Salmonella enterica]|uniref:Uncharacterized protein n=1 Tax=Salmonella enterica TaxID=28901 RepID=A0A743P7R4_SALER|nr:hypothetical protein [Salmonella enterica subsp. enterica serovar Veneziana]HAF2130973.1 hypothetical protein [Salmonella enterica]